MPFWFLGTSNACGGRSVHTACTVVRCGTEAWMFDCGDDTQRQVMWTLSAQLGARYTIITRIFVTSLEPCRVHGLPGMLATLVRTHAHAHAHASIVGMRACCNAVCSSHQLAVHALDVRHAPECQQSALTMLQRMCRARRKARQKRTASRRYTCTARRASPPTSLRHSRRATRRCTCPSSCMSSPTGQCARMRGSRRCSTGAPSCTACALAAVRALRLLLCYAVAWECDRERRKQC